MSVGSLRVSLYGRHVADILDAGIGLAGLRYTPEARAAGAAARVSLSLPVREEPYPAAIGPAMRWMRGLLPEGRALQAAVEQYQVPADDVFSLLSVLGRDVAGAVMITPPDEHPTEAAPDYLALRQEDLNALVRDVHDKPLGLDRSRGVRLSLAGVQDKLVLHRRGRQWYQPVGGAPSTVIVKPEPPPRHGVSLAGLATNEAFCLALARRAGLPAARADVRRLGGRPCLVVRRYDRRLLPDGTVERLHQEDFLSAMGRDPWLKYERGNARRLTPGGGFGESAPVRDDPGPGLSEVAALLEAHAGRASLLRLAGAAAFNVLIGNADAHARNYSLLLPPDGSVAFAPLYDVVCTRAHEGLTTDAAQHVNGVEDIDAVALSDLHAEAASWGLPPPLLAALDRVIDHATKGLRPAVQETVRKGGDPAHAHRVADIVAQRAERLLARG
ncbi:MAG TPA: HipA domain-containing protein [Candidatus Thermoplasmatota archaeon]|nr:HipA domain-containing protein [Candidatus Thermoplasmatota archaeon]